MKKILALVTLAASLATLSLNAQATTSTGTFNVLQKFSYIGVIFVVLPMMILTGITMSPAMNAAWPWLLDIFGGRQSARSIHFITATLMALFVIVHLIMVLLSGPITGIRSMITGRHVAPEKSPTAGDNI